MELHHRVFQQVDVYKRQEYTIYFTATKDGYTVQSAKKKLTVTKPNLSNAEITFPDGNVAAVSYTHLDVYKRQR